MFKPDYFIDLTWLNKISIELDQFTEVSTTNKTFVCRCPYCGDSKKSKKKARFYFYTKKGSLNFDCKNCGHHGSFYRFMKEQVPSDFDEYKKDQMLARFKREPKRIKDSSPVVSNDDNKTLNTINHLKTCQRLDELVDSHNAIKYLKSRSITPDMYANGELLYSPDFKQTFEEVTGEKAKDGFPSDARIVIPFYTEDGKIEMVQGRSLSNKSSLRYMTIKADQDARKLYGLERLDKKKTSYAVEGPFDSLFIDNCLATCDANLTSSGADVLIWDHQPRSKEIVELMEKAINDGHSLVIWPDFLGDTKIDINDMINMGMTRADLMSLIETRTFKGLKAKLEFSKWRKV